MPSLKHPELVNSQDIEADDLGSAHFCKVNLDELNLLVKLTQARVIHHRDLTVFWTFVSMMDWRTGRCRLTCARLSEELGINVNTIYLSVKRLRDASLILPYTEKRGGTKIYLVNPYIVNCGQGKQRGLVLKTFMEALNDAGGGSNIQKNDIHDGMLE